MKNEEIKSKCESIFAQIKDGEERLDRIREICKHEKTYEVNYSWRPGVMQLADVCYYCGELVRYK
jgi:hypothetical protein